MSTSTRRERPQRFATVQVALTPPRVAAPQATSASTVMRHDLMPPTRQAAAAVFWLLTAINFLNYLDRIVFVAVGPELKHTFALNDAQVGTTASAFLLVYTLTALPMGLLADRGSRTKIIAVGVALWSLATWYTAIAHTFAELFVGRAVLGIGEASYIPAGAALLAAYFPRGERAQVLSRWGASSLVGTAMGFVAGGIIAQHFGWRLAFFICGPPGLVLAYLIWRAKDRPAYDAADLTAQTEVATTQTSGAGSWQASVRGMATQAQTVLRSRTVRISIVLQALGLLITTPALVFVPIYLREHFHLSIQNTAIIAGAVIIPGGVLGTLLGGVIADRLSRRYAGGRMMTVGLAFAGGAPFYIAAFLTQNLVLLLVLAFIGVGFLNMYNGPLNAAIQDVVPAGLRSSAIAVIMTLAHLLGDVGSPTFVGHLVGWLPTHSVAHALVICSAPALVLGAVVAVWATGLYTRELAHQAT